jgi:prepilin-type N-terminal cleavage/methylation domain-containing protein/prepilin-type processing-associated H-X9-DG protein
MESDVGQKGFTLIELLVVVAIVAVLAALLFPIFIQAKRSAKATATLSQAKQISSAMTLYSGDYDDVSVIVAAMNETDATFITGLGRYKPWSMLVMPYLKSGAMFQDPMIEPEGTFLNLGKDDSWLMRTHFGYHYAAHSPVIVQTAWEVRPLSGTALAEPASTVLIATKKAGRQRGDYYFVFSPIFMGHLLTPPICRAGQYSGVNPNSLCGPIVRWGVGGFPSVVAPPSEEEGVLTAGLAHRKSGLAIVAFADGHVKAVSPAWLASGTNWTRTTPASDVQLTDTNRYLWDAD